MISKLFNDLWKFGRLSESSFNVQRSIPEFNQGREEIVDPIETLFSMEDHHVGELQF
jgi:hypothetical protein